MNSEYHVSAVKNAELMGVIANVQGIVIVNRSIVIRTRVTQVE